MPDAPSSTLEPEPIGEGVARLADHAPDVALTLGDRVYDQLLEAIMTGQLALGAKIRENELAQRFGVSRGPLREAIRRLEERRLVTRTAHVGARVVELSDAALLELFYVREALEGMAARLASQRMTDREIGDLAALLDAHGRMLGEGDHLDQDSHDVDFHYRIARGSRSELIEGLLCRDLYQLLKIYRRRHSAVPGRAQRALAEHRRIVDALADRDGELAEILMRRHIVAARKNVEDILRRENGRREPAEGDQLGGSR